MFRWNRLAAAWRHEGIGVTAPKLRTRLEQTSKFLAENPRHPDAEQVAAYQRHLEAMARRDLKTDAPKRRLLQLFSDVLVQSVWVLKVKESNGDSSCYYMRSRFDGKSNAIHYLGGFDDRERSKSITLSRVVYSDWSPQTKIANKFRSILGKESTFTNWEEVMLDLMTAIKSAPEMDPLLQVALLRKVAENAMEGSEALACDTGPDQGPSRTGRRRRERSLDGPRQRRSQPPASHGPGDGGLVAESGRGPQGGPRPPRAGRASHQAISSHRRLAGQGERWLASQDGWRTAP